MGGLEARSKARVVREKKSRGADMLSRIRVFGSFPPEGEMLSVLTVLRFEKTSNRSEVHRRGQTRLRLGQTRLRLYYNMTSSYSKKAPEIAMARLTLCDHTLQGPQPLLIAAQHRALAKLCCDGVLAV